MNYNKILFAGNLTRDPELKYTPSQTAIVNFCVANNHKWKDQSGTERQEVTFLECKMFGPRAEALSKYFKKGNPIFVEGRLTQENWKAKDGSNRSRLVLTVETWCFVDSMPKTNQQTSTEEPY